MLLEVIVATAILAASGLVLAATLTSAVRQAGGADLTRRAIAAAEEAAVAASRGERIGGDWQAPPQAGDSGAPRAALADAAPRCRRRASTRSDSRGEWVWIEAICGPARPLGDAPAGGAEPAPDERRVVLVVLR